MRREVVAAVMVVARPDQGTAGDWAPAGGGAPLPHVS